MGNCITSRSETLVIEEDEDGADTEGTSCRGAEDLIRLGDLSSTRLFSARRVVGVSTGIAAIR